MPELTDFLLDRIAEDEAVAQDALLDLEYEELWMSHAPSDNAYLSIRDHVERWTPARVLAETEAKRRIIAKHQRVKFTDVSLGVVDEDVCQKCHHVVDSPDEDHDDDWTYPLVQDDFPCKTLRYLASIWVDHPDFDPSWRVK